MNGIELEHLRGGFVACSWDCGSCGENGTARPWRRPGETALQAAARFAGETRGRCVGGCGFTAAPTPGGDGGNHGS